MRRKLSDNLKRVRDRLGAACAKVSRDPSTVKLVAVTKTVEIDVIRQMLEHGVTELGESRVQQLVKRAGMIEEYRSRRRLVGGSAGSDAPHWHMIGHLQRNKIKAVLPWVGTVHSVDNLRLAEDLSTQSQKMERTTDVFIEVNVSEERTKHGVVVGATQHLVEHMVQMSNLRVLGLMTMAPLAEDPEAARPYFARLRELLEDIQREKFATPDFVHLSMGMSNDFGVAVEEGATVVRIGTALFEGIAANVP
ncbi:MAG: YggS family pyridoxal phosphate-dependent enzyme [Phycisphaerae bacterium]|nr:YggS family pyridoxal phosphate-dependent enzyme [Phycisphaerae bacterium]